MTEPKKLNRIVIKEELVMLTGDFKLAIVLNQMIYWSERRHDADKFIAEEKERFNKQYNNPTEIVFMEPSYGWIYKKAEELVAETMMGLTVKTMLNYLNELTTKGWLQKRRNPKHDFDRTYQYRVDLIKIQTDLLILGYSLDGYDIGITNLQNVNCEISASIDNDEPEFKKVNTNLHNVNSSNSEFDRGEVLEPPKVCNLQKVNTNDKKVNTNDKKVITDCKNVRAIPETTTETTSEITNLFVVEGKSEKEAENLIETDKPKILKQYIMHNMFLELFDTPIPDSVLPYLTTLTEDQVELVFNTLKDRLVSGVVLNPVGILINNPESVIKSIIYGRFYPEIVNNTCVIESEYSVFEKVTGISMIAQLRRSIYDKWRLQWGYSAEMVLRASELMCRHTTSGSMEYIDRILSTWHQNNIKTPEEVKVALEEHNNAKINLEKSGSKFQEFFA